MHIGIVTYQSIFLLKGGPWTQILETKRGLESAGIKVTMFDSWQGFRGEKVDCVHLFGAHIGTFHTAREIHKLGIPMVVTPIFFSARPAPVLRAAVMAARAMHGIAKGVWTDYGLLAEICGWADAVAPNTVREGELLRRAFGIPREKITVIPNGVSRRFSTADPALFRKKYGIDQFVLNTGHVGPGRKNVFRLIQALEKINVPSVIIGRIERNAYALECLAEAKRNPRLMILDEVPNDSDLLASAYAACDVFALPSLFETPGIAALEAALAGAKIVITKHGGTEEYFGGEAEYVEPTSAELIRHGIVTALNKPRTDTLKQHVLASYTWDRISGATADLYGRLCGGSR